ncbi:uncharacterized protein LOC121189129 isoform X2 [Toxotes jaculatrix]|uniref:uncharacterized protein LOC121189129 isoform X2 n=1 Tax=Toxotes jaculatrix TaxID=941984 RepID=UPI001B3AB621|nr:uncharacterized protein LOC121189129 isoform X2 [Toxotes jaculatrix]
MCFMKWGVALMLFCCVQERVKSHEIEVKCREYNGSPAANNISPSLLADLKVEKVTVGKNYMLNVSWAINIDASIKYLNGTLIKISGEPDYYCEYDPHLTKANITGQVWFHYLVKVGHGDLVIQAANLPLPPLNSGPSYKFVQIRIPYPKQPPSPQIPTDFTPRFKDFTPVVTTTSPLEIERVAVIIFGALGGLMILSSCFIMYKSFGHKIARIPWPPMVPVPVLLVYPPENPAFQQAVVALAEFLQCHSSCSVAIDMWQQGRIAELGPIRWLAEQAKAADQVLIICPQPSSQPGYFPPNRNFPEPSIPAAAHDLYPLILNMVASHTKSANDLAKFWVVQLGKQQDKGASKLPLELRACKSFCLMKDLKKLCRSLHSHRQDKKKISDLIFRSGVSFSEKSTAKLRKAIEKHFQRGDTTLELSLLYENV